MPSAASIIANALKACIPTEAESKRIDNIATMACDLVKTRVSNCNEVVSVEFGGSYAKGTWLPGHADIDVFVKIKPTVTLDRFEELGKSIGQKAMENYDPTLRYSDHPYVEALIENTKINIVPCYDVPAGKWISAADRSPFHTSYVNQVLDVEKKNNVRVLKLFLKAVGVYGAEIATGGFSGYVTEVLIAKFTSILGVLEGIADFRHRQVVALGDYDADIVKVFQSAMILIDPVDPKRNLGAAISNESAAEFILASRAFLKNPSKSFFTGRRAVRPSKTLFPNVLVIEFSHRQRSPDVIWGQLKRSTAAVAKQLDLAGFSVIRSSCVTDEKKSAAIALLLESVSIPLYMARKGPEVFRRADTAKFLENITGAKVVWADKDLHTAILVRRKATSAESYVKSLFLRPNSGLSFDLVLPNTVKIYRGAKQNISGLVKSAVDNVAGTEWFFNPRG